MWNNTNNIQPDKSLLTNVGVTVAIFFVMNDCFNKPTFSILDFMASEGRVENKRFNEITATFEKLDKKRKMT